MQENNKSISVESRNLRLKVINFVRNVLQYKKNLIKLSLVILFNFFFFCNLERRNYFTLKVCSLEKYSNFYLCACVALTPRNNKGPGSFMRNNVN